MPRLIVTFQIDTLHFDTFSVLYFKLEEKLSSPYSLHLHLISEKEILKAESIVDKNARFTFWEKGHPTRYIHGVVSSFASGDCNRSYKNYYITLVPSFYRLSLRHNCRIFQKKTTKEIIIILLNEMGIKDYLFSLTSPLLTREYCVQYKESDLEFISRLASEEGLIYYFSHEKNQHLLIFTDNSKRLETNKNKIRYHVIGGGVSHENHVYHLKKTTLTRPSSVCLTDYCFKKPAYHFQQQIDIDSSKVNYQKLGYEHYDYPGGYKTDEQGRHVARNLLEALRVDSLTFSGASNVNELCAGVKINLTSHPEEPDDLLLLITQVIHEGSQPQSAKEAANIEPATYNNTFNAILGKETWQTQPIAKPDMGAVQIAVVTGPRDETIFCDEFGRVRIKFRWDRDKSDDEKSSCWVRVSQAWAGAQFGTVTLPRVGNEVLVSFVNGDPDQPIIIGRTFQATNKPPYQLPQHKTKTVIRTETYQGTGFNELSFEDQSGQEMVLLRAQRDFENLTLNDHNTNIKNNHKLMIGNDDFSQIKNDKHHVVKNNSYLKIENSHHVTIEKDSRTKIKKDCSLMVDGNLNVKINDLYTIDTGKDLHIKGGANVVIEAGSSLTLKVAGHFLTIDASGVSIVGSEINLNSGGSPESGSGFSGLAPDLPEQNDSDKKKHL